MIFAKIHDRCGAFLRDARKIFLLSLGVGIVLSIISILAISDIYRDVANVYAYQARELGNGGFAAGWFGAVPMFSIVLAGGLVRLGMESYRACVVISCLFYVLTLFPLRRYLERWLSPLASSYGCLLFIIAPKVIRYSVSGLIDSTRYFFLIGALLFLFRLIEDPTWRRAVMFGLCSAGLAVSRGEGVVVSLILLSAFPLLAFLPRKNSGGRRPFPRYLAAAVALVVFLVGTVPFCTVNWVKYNVFATDIRLAGEISTLKDKLCSHRSSEPPKTDHNVPREEKPSLHEHIWDCTNNSLIGGFELYWVFSLLGILTLLYRRKWRWEFSALLIAYLIHQAIYFSVGAAYRYSIYLVPMFMPFTVTGMALCLEAYMHVQISDRWRAMLNTAGVVGALVAIVAFINNGMKIVITRSDNPKREAAAFIRNWGERNISGRRLRIANDGSFPEVIFWSGAYRVSGITHPHRWDECRDCDLILVGDEELPAAKARTDLTFLKSFVLGKDDQCHLFQAASPAGKAQR